MNRGAAEHLEAAAGSGAEDRAAEDARDTAAENSTAADAGDAAADTAAAGESGEAPRTTAVFRTALVSGVSLDLPNPHPTVVLRESEPPRRQLSFAVSLQDGTVLSHAVRRIATPRPLTHELLSEVLRGFDIDVVAVRLVGRRGSVYFAELDLRGPTGRSVHSCRPSDALAVALVQPVPVPILIDSRLLDEHGDVTPIGAAPP